MAQIRRYGPEQTAKEGGTATASGAVVQGGLRGDAAQEPGPTPRGHGGRRGLRQLQGDDGDHAPGPGRGQPERGQSPASEVPAVWFENRVVRGGVPAGEAGTGGGQAQGATGEGEGAWA